MLQRQHAADSLPLLLSLTLRNCVLFVQDDGKRSEAISMLEESSQAGCLQSSYLLWQHSRKAAVSQVLSLPCFEIYSQKHAPLVKTAVCLGFISYLHSQSNVTSKCFTDSRKDSHVDSNHELTVLFLFFLVYVFQIADPGRYLQCVRTLRDYAGKGCWEAQVCD